MKAVRELEEPWEIQRLGLFSAHCTMTQTASRDHAQSCLSPAHSSFQESLVGLWFAGHFSVAEIPLDQSPHSSLSISLRWCTPQLIHVHKAPPVWQTLSLGMQRAVNCASFFQSCWHLTAENDWAGRQVLKSTNQAIPSSLRCCGLGKEKACSACSWASSMWGQKAARKVFREDRNSRCFRVAVRGSRAPKSRNEEGTEA